MSKRKILPAIILAGSLGFLGLHRIYARRFITGLLQMILFIVGAKLIWPDIISISELETIDDIQGWVLTHQMNPLGTVLVSIPVVWAAYDCILLLARRFKDGDGNQMTAWI